MKSIQIYTVLILALLQSDLLWSQVDFDPSIPSPSAMSTYQDVPVDYCTGIPDISYGLVSLPTANKSLSFNLGLSYHPNNSTVNCKATDVGRGWSWSGIPTITKNITHTHDETTWYSTITPEWAPTALDDVYYYSINGESGRFKFVYNYSTGTSTIKMLNPTLLKFTFVTTSTESLVVDSFRATDSHGIVYNFQKYDITKIGSFSTGTGSRTSFHLTSAYNSNNAQLCSITYNEVYSQMAVGLPIKVASVNKINEITATGIGKLKFNYTTNTAFINKDLDISRLNDISLLTLSNQQIKKCSFNYNNVGGRGLVGISFMGNNATVVENYKFEYREATFAGYDGELVWGTDLVKKHDRYGFAHIVNRCSVADLAIPKSTFYTNINTVASGILQKVTLPTGGMIVYDFEPNEIDANGYQMLNPLNFRSTNVEDDFDEALLGNQVSNTFLLKPLDPDTWTHLLVPRTDDYYLVNLGRSTYSVTSTDTGKFFQMTQDTELFVRFEGYANPTPLFPDGDPPIGFQIKQGTTVIATYMMHYEPNACVRVSPKIDLTAGWYTIHIVSPNGGSVDYTMYARRKNAVEMTNYYAGGVRIKTIKHYEDKNATVPQKSVLFEYNDFNTPQRSSGGIFFKGLGRNVDTYDGIDTYVLYKNVKVSEDGNGYTKYHYYIRGDFDDGYTNYFYKILKEGLLGKKEVFNSQHHLLEADKYYYEAKVGDPVFLDYKEGEAYYIKRKYTKTERYLSGASPTVLKSVVINNDWSLKPESVTTFDSQNKKLKTRYYYLNELPSAPHASSLTTKNILSEPHVVEQYYDGVLMSRAKSEYDSFGNGLFKKAKSYTAKGTGDYTLEQRVSKMDNVASKVQEVTNDKGAYTSYIWGYNKTQPVAKIENMAYATIPAGLITAVQGATNIANNEANILTALDALRNGLPNAMVTTYTYKPLVGIQSVTDPKGDRVTYHYDTFNRVVAIKDSNNNLLTENQYHFRPQN